MRKFTFLKTLLMAVGLCMGGSAWGAETWDFTNTTTWGSITLPTSGTPSVSYNASGEAASTGNFVTFYSTTGKIAHAYTLSNGFGFTSDGSTSDHYIKISVPAGYTATITVGATNSRKIASSFNGSETTYTSGTTKSFENTTGSAIDLYVYGKANSAVTGNYQYLKKIVLMQAFAVTTNYIDEESNTVKTSVTEYVESGETYSTPYTTPYYKSNTDPYTYTYKSGAVTGATITATTVYNVIYTKTDRPSYTITTVQSYGNMEQTTNNVVYEGASFTYYYPRHFLVGKKLYQYDSSTDPNANASYWTSTLTNVSANATYTQKYKPVDGYCVYYSDGEDVTGATQHGSGSTFAGRSSNGLYGVFPSPGIAVTNLAAGTYELYARVVGKASSGGSTNYIRFYKNSNEDANKIIEITQNAYGNLQHTTVELSEATDIVAEGGATGSGDNGQGIDYIYIMKTPSAVETAIADVELNVGTQAFATYIENKYANGDFSTAADVYAAHTAWQIEQAEDASSLDFTNVILNAGFEQGTINDWTIYGDASAATADADKYGVIESNGTGGYQYYTGWNGRNVSQNIYGLPAGVYRLSAKIYSWSGGAPVRLFANGTLSTAENGEDHEPTLDFVVSGSEASVKIGVGGTGKEDDTDKTWGTWGYRVNYFTLTKIASVSGTITDAGWSTFASSYPLDLSTISGGTAYYASAASGSTVTLTSTTATVPAGEGIMVNGTAGDTFTIGVAASGTAISGNLLKGQTTTGNVDASNKNDNGKYHYVFGYSKSDATEYGFYNLTADTEVAAGKAYLETTTALTAGARLTIIFDDETTGISDASRLMDNGERKNDNFFNLNGQRVEKPAKGLYIVNGKKVVMK